MSLFRSFYDIAGWISSLERRVSALERMEELTIVAKYRTNAGQSIPDNTVTIIDFEDQDHDTHSAVTTGAAWKFTAPINGYYLVSSCILFASTTAWDESENIIFLIYVDGVLTSQIDRRNGQDFSGSTGLKAAAGSDTIYLASSSYLDIRIVQQSGGSLSLLSDGVYNYVAIARVG